MSDSTSKTCTKCGHTLPLDSFHADKSRRDGRKSQCKACRHQASLRWYDATAETRREYSREYHHAHKDEPEYRARRRAYGRAWMVARYHSDPTYRAGAIARAAEWVRTHRDEMRFHRLRWRRRNPVATRIIAARRRARMDGGTLTAKDVQRQMRRQAGRCYWCGCDTRDVYHIDHVVPLARGGAHDASNVVISCPNCNQAKGSKLPHEFGGRLC